MLEQGILTTFRFSGHDPDSMPKALGGTIADSAAEWDALVGKTSILSVSVDMPELA